MRSILAGACGLTLGLGSVLTESPTPAANLGRPVPAASLGRPTALTTASGQQPFQPAAYRAERPAPIDSAPLLAPILNSPTDEPLPAPRPLPGDGSPGSTAVPPPGILGGGAP